MKIDIFWDQRFREESYVIPTMDVTDIKSLDIKDSPYGDTYPESLKHIQSFVAAAQKKYPYFSFGVRSTYLRSTVYVYMPEHCYTLGAIGYGDFTDESTKDDPNTYTVWSPYIRNRRYHFGSQMNMKSSQHMAKAVDNMKYIRPHTASSYFLRAGRSMDDAYTSVVEEQRDKIIHARVTITNHHNVFFSDLLAAHRHSKLLDVQPYKFSEVLANKLDKYIATVAEGDDILQNISTSMCQVRTTEHGFEVTLLSLGKSRFKGNGNRGDADVTMHPAQTYARDELPRAIVRKLSVLDMAHSNTKQRNIKFILGIGWTAIKGHLYYVTV